METIPIVVLFCQGVSRWSRHRPGLSLWRGVQPWVLPSQTHGPIHPLWYVLIFQSVSSYSSPNFAVRRSGVKTRDHQQFYRYR